MTKKLKRILPKKSGRGASGRINVRHKGGRQKRFLREIGVPDPDEFYKLFLATQKTTPPRSDN